MRVISGSARGLKLSSPPGTETRPTLDRVKEAVFSMLLPYLNEASVLDLFAGSGAMGIEALSRGACSAVFIDNSQQAVSCVRKNLDAARLADNAVVVYSDSTEYLKQCDKQFDLIFIDPPYADGLYEKVLRLIDENNLLTSDGIIVVEWDFELGFTNDFGNFKLFKEKKYGRVGIAVLKRSIVE